MFVARKQSALLYPTGSPNDPNKNHLLIVLNDPHGPPGQVLLVPICSIKPPKPHDATCELKAGDHGFLRHDSYIDYYFARTEPAQKLVEGVKRGVFVDKGTIDQPLYERIVAGLYSSKFTPRFAKTFLSEVAEAEKRANKAASAQKQAQ